MAGEKQAKQVCGKMTIKLVNPIPKAILIPKAVLHRLSFTHRSKPVEQGQKKRSGVNQTFSFEGKPLLLKEEIQKLLLNNWVDSYCQDNRNNKTDGNRQNIFTDQAKGSAQLCSTVLVAQAHS